MDIVLTGFVFLCSYMNILQIIKEWRKNNQFTTESRYRLPFALTTKITAYCLWSKYVEFKAYAC